ncbi:hypothetical protein LCGC14_2126740, partial [marine sediment metagenome]
MTMVQRAIELNQPALALTDHGTLGGYLRFHHECEELGIKPILGIEFYVADDLYRQEKAVGFDEDHLIVLARTWKGLQSLFKLVDISFQHGYYYRPRIDEKHLLEHASDDLVVLSGCVSSKLCRMILNNQRTAAKKHIDRMQNAYNGNYFVEIQPHDFRLQLDYNSVVVDVAKEVGARLVATNDSHYLTREEAETHDVLLAVQTGARLDDPNRFRFEVGSCFIASRQDMSDMFRAHSNVSAETVSGALDMTMEVVDLIDFKMPVVEDLSTKVQVPSEYRSRRDWFLQLIRDGWVKRNMEWVIEYNAARWNERIGDVRDEYRDRVLFEVDTIERLGFSDYFITVHEMYTDLGHLPHGPGRGSVGGSLVAYLLDIHNVEPITYDLQFERFLNPDRTSPPDIDMDWAPKARDEVIDWFRERFGEENVAHIGTWGTLGGKMGFKDVCRVHGVPLNQVEKIADLIDESVTETTGSEIDAFKRNWPGVIRAAGRLEGLARQRGVHAAGIVASPVLREITSIEMRGPPGKREPCTALTGKEVEKIGLVKWDVLGVGELEAVEIAKREIKKNHDLEWKEPGFDLNDPSVLASMQSGHTVGIFQFDTLIA